MRLSHERLEQDLLAKPLTLRETLVRLRALSTLDRGVPLPGAAEFLQLLAQSCQLEVAAVFALRRDGAYEREPVATLGPARSLDLADLLLAYGLEQGDLMHVQIAQAGAQEFDHSRYLVCARSRHPPLRWRRGVEPWPASVSNCGACSSGKTRSG